MACPMATKTLQQASLGCFFGLPEQTLVQTRGISETDQPKELQGAFKMLSVGSNANLPALWHLPIHAHELVSP